MSGFLLDTDLDAEQREFAETVRSSSDALVTIVNDILDFSKIAAGKLIFEKIEFVLLATAESTGAGRGRLKSDTSLRPTHPPRAMILATGEEKPSEESLIARMFLVEVAPGDIDPKRLSACQRDAAAGLYAQATAGYIQWLAPRLDQVRVQMNSAHGSYREQATHAGLHRRTPRLGAVLHLRA